MKAGFTRKVMLWFLVVSVLGTLVVPAYGNELDKLKKQQQETNKDIQAYRSVISQKNRELRSLTDQLREIDENISATEKDLESLQGQLAVAQTKVGQAETALQEAEKSLAVRNEIFSNRLVEIYCHGDVNFLEVLLSSASITDFLVRFELLSKIADQDIELLEAIEAEKAEIEEVKKELEARRDEIIQLKAETEKKQANLEGKREQQEKLKYQIDNEKEAAEKALAEEERTSQELAKKIREIQAKLNKNKPKSKYTGGTFTWPTPGYEYVTSDYKMRLHPLLKVKKMHTGIDIRAPKGAKVVAGGEGTVSYAGWFGAYGNAVMIEHGGNITTLYAHLSAFTVKEGDTVEKGDQIGKVGTSGLSTGYHLHFEVRVSGDHVNPWNYLK